MHSDPLPVRGLDIHPLPSFLAGTDGGIEYLNPRIREYAGLPVDDLLGWEWGWVVHPDDLPGTLARWAASVRDRTPNESELRIRRWDGAYRWFRVRVDPVRDADGAVLRWVGAGTDIDDLRRVWAEARAAGRLVRAFVERWPDGRALVGADGVVRYASSALAGLLGAQQDAVVGTDARDWVHRDDRPRLGAAVAVLLARPGERMAAAARVRQSDGAYRRVRVEAVNLLPDPDVRAVAVVVAADAGG